ncbi:zinc-binding alcohol dehydrogenase family protein [Halocella sp. SP3-1]|uniref:zinc-binding alcohol dehydrogenase family protein n=1 Tax=Halocella sp. SP3-1 TaxID=2382161 RepID=UPI000F759C4E|nr:zinc-binding alcohol dehydrogenase family protein [Halocella sp. SP3-1]AZO93429.1 zinc-binding alcohol dehydrogenase family protein [Halocella sp. SP3-1]
MKAVQITEPGKIDIIEKERPKIKDPTDVIIKIKRVGICGSDLHIFQGHNPFASYPRVWGHEFVGEIVETGQKVENVQIGDHVVGEPIKYCGECYPCRQGRGNVCENLKVYGVHIDGGCQEYVLMNSKHVYVVDKKVSWDEAILIEPLTIGAQVCFRSDLKKDDVILIMGSGTIGLCILQIAKTYGITAIMTDIINDKLNYATTLGADYVINAKDEDVNEKVMEITKNMGANVIADTVCSKESFKEAVSIASAGGRVVVLGFGPTPSKIQQVLITKKELNIVGSRLQTKRFPLVIKLMNERKLNLNTFVTHHYPIDKVEEAFNFAIDNPSSFRKIVIDNISIV